MSVMGFRACVSAALGTHLNGINASRVPGRARAGTNRGIYASTGASASECGFAPPRRPRARTADRHRKRFRPERRHVGPRTSPASRRRQCGQSADAAKDNQRKTDEFVEAAQAINGPAGNPECVWLGRRVVRLMWLDDLDTAFRHLDLYDRFGCPGGHVQATFRCLTRFGGADRPQGGRDAEQPRSRLLDQSERRSRRRPRRLPPRRAGDRRQRRAGPRRHAPAAPAAAPAPAK